MITPISNFNNSGVIPASDKSSSHPIRSLPSLNWLYAGHMGVMPAGAGGIKTEIFEVTLGQIRHQFEGKGFPMWG